MDETRAAAVVLAALEQAPGEPADLTRVLRDPVERRTLLGADHDGAGWPPHLPASRGTDVPETDAPASELVQYLVEVLDHGRVGHWAKILERGVRDERYRFHLAGDREYPDRLTSVWDAPPILFSNWASEKRAEGFPGATRVALAIVGRREASAAVLASTREVAVEVARHGADVVSGLAAGVDTAAHIAALEAGGTTTAVLGTGIERVFPKENAGLAAEIVERGRLLSQFVPDAPRTGTTFLRRNSVIAAISDASLVMDGLARSGSRHEVEQAIRYGKPVLLWRPALGCAEWAARLESEGVAAFVESPEEVLRVLS